MAFREDPPFQHRILVVLLAKAIQWAFPAFGDIRCFLLSQIPAILLLFWMVRRWAALFVGRTASFAAQGLLCVMLLPTFRYFTFYDVTTVLVFTAALYCLARGYWWRYLACFTIGTFNHEVTLFLIPVSAVILWKSEHRSKVMGRVVLQLVVYGLARALLFATIPASTAWQLGKLDFNLTLLWTHPGWLATAAMTLVPWWVLAALGWKWAPRFLKRAALLLPLLAVMTLVFGQLNEPRNFNALMPVTIGLVLCWLRSLAMPGAEPGETA